MKKKNRFVHTAEQIVVLFNGKNNRKNQINFMIIVEFYFLNLRMKTAHECWTAQRPFKPGRI